MSSTDPAVIEMLRLQLVKAAQALNLTVHDAKDWRVRRQIELYMDKVDNDSVETRKAVAIAEMRATGLAGRAAESAGIAISTLEKWKQRDDEFADAFREAGQHAREAAELRLREKAMANSDDRETNKALIAYNQLLLQQQRLAEAKRMGTALVSAHGRIIDVDIPRVARPPALQDGEREE